jgi:hypothetical protein
MISLLASPIQAAYTVAHELFHLQFWHLFKHQITQCEERIRDEYTEIMTAILDKHISTIIPLYERVELNSFGLRRKAQQLWESTNDLHHVASEILIALSQTASEAQRRV